MHQFSYCHFTQGHDDTFLAPTGALEVTMSVCPSVRPFGGMLSRAVNIHHSSSNLQAISQE